MPSQNEPDPLENANYSYTTHWFNEMKARRKPEYDQIWEDMAQANIDLLERLRIFEEEHLHVYPKAKDTVIDGDYTIVEPEEKSMSARFQDSYFFLNERNAWERVEQPPPIIDARKPEEIDPKTIIYQIPHNKTQNRWMWRTVVADKVIYVNIPLESYDEAIASVTRFRAGDRMTTPIGHHIHIPHEPATLFSDLMSII